MPSEVTEVVAASAERYVASFMSPSRENGMPHRVNYVDGDRYLSVHFDSEGSASFQFGRRLSAELPPLLEEWLNFHSRFTLDESVLRLLDRSTLMLAGHEIEAAVRAGSARVIERNDVTYAIPATVVEVEAAERGLAEFSRVWVDNRHGIKFRVEEVRGISEIRKIGMMVGYQLGVDLGGVDFSPPVLREVKADYLESLAFDEESVGVVDTSGVEGLLHPGSDPIYENLRLWHSAYVTGTQETDPGWFVAQELRSDTGARALVLQGDDRRSLPIQMGSRPNSMVRYWPPDWWDDESVDRLLLGELRDPADFRFTDGTAARVYECTPQGDLTIDGGGGLRIDWLQAMDCDELITWVDGTHNRVVLSVTDYDRPTAIDVAMAFRSAAHGRDP
jgi:hypothetical protein